MLAIAGGKGGVGKTTTALGIGVALAARRRDPVLVDADRSMPNLHLVADVPDDGVAALADGASIEEATSQSDRYGGVRILGSTPDAPLERALRSLVTDRPVVVDSPAGASPDAVYPLRVADHAIVVTSPGARAVRDAVTTARMARAVGTPVVAWVVTRSDSVPPSVTAAAGETPTVPVPALPSPATGARRAYDAAATAWVNA
ncbi:MAG: MinD/ParA family protein [Halanaeroarchaeum sp.]